MIQDTVSFQTPGLIDPRCISTIGVSVKETENPIGFFGTGMKYAIAIILRNEGEITIWRGLQPIRFTTKEIEVRGKPCKVVCMDGQELGFTVELGKHWKMWQAFRELYCNTLDEKGETASGAVEPKEGNTTIHVMLREFAECYADIEDYFLLTQPIYEGNSASFHPGPTNAVFYRTVRVGERLTEKPLMFAPNLKGRVDLTEDRTIRDTWLAHWHIARAVLECNDKRFIERWLTVGDQYGEHTFDVDFPSITPTPEFLEVAFDLSKDMSRPVNITVPKVLGRHRAPPKPVEAQLLPTERAKLEEAVAFCKALAYTVDDFPIVVVEALGKGVLGVAQMESRRILLARRAIQMGDLTLAATLIEEWAHIKFGFDDCSREMQNWLFEQITRLCEEVVYARKAA